MAKHTIKMIITVMVMNLLLAMAFSYGVGTNDVGTTINESIALQLSYAQKDESNVGFEDSSGQPNFSPLFKTDSTGESYLEGLVQGGNTVGTLWFFLTSAIVPYGILVSLGTASSGNLILSIFVLMISFVIISMNLAMYLRLYKLVTKGQLE